MLSHQITAIENGGLIIHGLAGCWISYNGELVPTSEFSERIFILLRHSNMPDGNNGLMLCLIRGVTIETKYREDLGSPDRSNASASSASLSQEYWGRQS
mgnify:FL=1|jgi:hypothetical protein